MQDRAAAASCAFEAALDRGARRRPGSSGRPSWGGGVGREGQRSPRPSRRLPQRQHCATGAEEGSAHGHGCEWTRVERGGLVAAGGFGKEAAARGADDRAGFTSQPARRADIGAAPRRGHRAPAQGAAPHLYWCVVHVVLKQRPRSPANSRGAPAGPRSAPCRRRGPASMSA